MDRFSAKFHVALLCGGPSLERGISLNSARSVVDHLESEEISVQPIYFDFRKNPYKISRAQLYCNTPSDFDFKLNRTATPFTERSLVRFLRAVDIIFPVMHGPFGEDGEIQSFLERYNLPFVGSGAKTCKKAFDKFTANEYIKQHGFFTLPSVVLKIYHHDHKYILERFFKEYRVKRAVVKPASGGSSIGVFSVSSAREALEKSNLLFSRRMDTRVVVEPFAKGAEFTTVMLENRFGLPVALPPTEIETDYAEHQIFDFRKKYLPTRQVTWHCPPRFDNWTIEKIQAQAEQLFALFHMRDFGRFDGWVLPGGDIWFCDLNPISGMEQNSFLFQQASRIGMTHGDVLRHIVRRACERYGIDFPEIVLKPPARRKKVNIIMGGDNSERQVSLISGTNVWLKLRRSKRYEPQPYLLDTRGYVWRLPYHLCLNHTVEEIAEDCEGYQYTKNRLAVFEERARLRLGFLKPKDKEEFFEPSKLAFKKFIKTSDLIFIALHGGDGENGNLQKLLGAQGVKFNGPYEEASRLCMDKWDTASFINNAGIAGVSAIPGKTIETRAVLRFDDRGIRLFWRKTRKEIGAKTLIVKPRADGCTTGVVHLRSPNDLKKYAELLFKKAPVVPRQTFRGQRDIIEMPPALPRDLLFEKFIETDALRVKAGTLKYQRRTGWIEITVGIVEIDGELKVLSPSITMVESEVLTVEEKFQGGTGVNITPPPPSIMKPAVLKRVKDLIEEVARKIGIRGYSRIDAFANVDSGDALIIEVNTLPGLTPSTVFFHQALAESPPLFPAELLEILIRNKRY
ncbi:MAG: hypothetical protein A3J67_01050 [Parcubacteria group bacterium RIFCSPHIGHO2_02_FULL_48_10b]|nr:MAG: hypothetical protein A3J67_01050 [Parcubacteria group bacterium RIFCSPHIGHO2_02_FULL_48_10b]